jgi:hypothetical protein
MFHPFEFGSFHSSCATISGTAKRTAMTKACFMAKPSSRPGNHAASVIVIKPIRKHARESSKT